MGMSSSLMPVPKSRTLMRACVGVSRTEMMMRPPSLLYLMALDIRLRMIVLTMSTSQFTEIGPGMSYSTEMLLTCATRSDILLAKTTTSEMSTS